LSASCAEGSQEGHRGVTGGGGTVELRLRVYLCPTGKLFMSSFGAPFSPHTKFGGGNRGNVNYETESIFNREILGEGRNVRYTAGRMRKEPQMISLNLTFTERIAEFLSISLRIINYQHY